MKDKQMTLCSLFDGSGGFCLAGLMAGIKPISASEIEPFPIRVTTKRLPFVKHLGDVAKIHGAEIEPVDIITFGSPCQDLSLAGKRAGLGGSRSNLFYEAIRIVKEMREATNGEKPRYIVWENVPGAFSSNKGEDFKAVLDAVCGIKESEADTPRPAKWHTAGCILADDYSVAWRVLDAQYWGVPQRRRRIYLVADLDGQRAGKILFESEGLSGYFTKGGTTRQETAGAAEESAGASGRICLNDQGGNRMDVTEDVTATLRAKANHPPVVTEAAGFCTEHSAKSRSIGYEEETAPTLRAGVVPAAVFENHSQDTRYTGPLEVAPPVMTTYGTGGNNQPFVVEDTPKTLKIRSGCEGGGKGALIQDNKSATLGCHNDQTLFVPKAYGICSKESNAMKSDNPNSGFYEAETTRTLDANGGNPSCNQGGMAVVCVDMGGGKSNVNISKEQSPTLAATHGGEPVIAFSDIHAALSANDGLKGPSSQMLKSPEENFVCETIAIEGNGARPSHQGKGYSEDDVSFTLNATEKHAIAYGIDRAAFNQGANAQYSIAVEKEIEPTIVAKGPGAVSHPVYHSSKASFHTKFSDADISDTLVASDYKDPPTVSEEPYYIVRRLTPTECARLQGFPDWWCDGLETENPTDEDLSFWRKVFDTYADATGSKPKTDAQIIKWLKKPHSDSKEYAMWGNGICVNCGAFVLFGIVYYDRLFEKEM